MKHGTEITWSYTHHLNSRSSVRRTKHGVYHSKIKHTARHWNKPGAVQMAHVKFSDNKRSTIVPFDELKRY